MRLRRARGRSLGPEVQHLLARATAEARGLNHGFVGTEHVLLAFLADGDDAPAHALHALGVTAADVRAAIVEAVGRGPAPRGSCIDTAALATIGIDFDEVRRAIEDKFGPGAIDRTGAGRLQRTRRLDKALDEARRSRGFFVASDDVLLAIARDADSLAARILRCRGIGVAELEAALARARDEAA